MRLRTRGVLATLPLALALALTGCGGDGEDGSGVASAGGEAAAGTGAGAGAGAGKSLSPEEMGVKFAQCMRENGVQMEDPKPGQGLKITSKGADRATMEKAQEACREFNPMAEGGGAPDPEAQERARKHAECMRENGVEAFPDPKPNQRGIRINAEVGQDPDFEAAEQECQKLLQGGKKKGGPQ
ncbi:hypothetical protein [Actinomadura sp. WMMB 499]|uniref:hypothetical protein n=1 Tax=Actinomadura sp. WMMB 499 TaxID=1219491 RepID=UPI00124432A3|nr:hypothetical protein [Actinomadura sp. WMMB 499]QFG24426.1 hypothetical protein F7P10_28165 [Actinomadura sp. WMMB 499]